jgi:hypothetical protein
MLSFSFFHLRDAEGWRTLRAFKVVIRAQSNSAPIAACATRAAFKRRAQFRKLPIKPAEHRFMCGHCGLAAKVCSDLLN